MPPVNLGPAPIATFLDSTGEPLAGGFIYTYEAGTLIQQATYTDSTGATPNPNPVVLNSAGQAEIWFSASAYKIIVQDLNNVQQYEADNFQVGVFASGNNAFTGNNTHAGTETFNGAIIANDGGALNGTFTGNPSFTGAPIFSGTITASQLVSTVATGTPPLVAASTTVVPNLNVENVNGVNYPVGGAVGTVPSITSPNNVSYLTAETILILGGYQLVANDVVPVQVTNTTTETQLYGFTLAANQLGVGSILRLHMQGLASGVSGDGSTLTLRIRIDGVQILQTAMVPTTLTDRGWSFDVCLGLGTIGASAQLYVTGGNFVFNPDGSNSTVTTISGGNSSGYVTLNSTASHTVTLTAQWSSGVTTSESLVSTLFICEELA